MIRHIPPFILQNYEQEIFSGNFEGFTLLFDIADFTKIGTSLQKQGKKGAEELSRFLEEIFHVPIDSSEQNGGFVSVFAGDAVCVLFPDGKPENVLKAVVEIRDHFRKNNRFETAFGSFDVKVRLTITVGEISWRIFRNATQNEYVFFGDTIREMAELSGLKVDVLFSDDAGKDVGKAHIEKLETGYRLMDDAVEIDCEPRPLLYEYSPATVDSFVRKAIQDLTPGNEIRSAAYCFCNLEGIPNEERENAISRISHLADTYGGFVNKLDATDKGLIAILLFGLPKTEGKTLERICSFALKATDSVPDIALGISFGSVFAGFTGSGETHEYTALGHPMNLSARLMSKAKAGEVLTDHYLQKELRKTFDFESIGEIDLRGISYPIQHYRLLGKSTLKQTQHAAEFVGRETEFATIRKKIDRHLQDKTNLAYYVVGDAGVGKSRLFGEIMRTYDTDEYHAFHLHCDAILQKPLEIIKQLLRQHFHFDPTMEKSRGIESFRAQWQTIAGDDAELKRIESILASLLGYEWEGSIWSFLPGNEKPSQQRNAFTRFMQQIAQKKPILIHLDDPQWIDDSSKEYLQLLGEKQVSPIVILAACRYTDDGNVPDLELPNCASETMELSTLTTDVSRSLIASILELESIPDATIEAINNKAAGNPFFIEQLVAWLTENDHLDAVGNLTEELDMSATFSISDVIGSRVDRLTEEVRECVYHASVLGMEFDVQVLSKMLNRHPDAHLEDGRQSRIWKVLNEIRYIFSHILIRDIVYQRMMSERLKELHKLAVEAMEVVYADDEQQLNEHAEEIADHFQQAGCEEQSAEYYHQAGGLFLEKYQFDRAERNLRLALSVREQILGTEHPETASSLQRLAALYKSQGKYEQAESLYLRVLEITEKVLGPEHPHTAISLNNLANLYRSQGKYEQAEPLFLRALQIKEKVLGAEHPGTAISLNNLADLYRSQGKYEQAEPLHLRALQIDEKVLGAEHPGTAISLNNLALLYRSQGKYEQAEPLHLRALQIVEKVLGAEHPSTAISLNNLAHLYTQQGKYEQAEPLFLRALKIFEKVQGAEHPHTQKTIKHLTSLYEQTGDEEKAAHYRAMLEDKEEERLK